MTQAPLELDAALEAAPHAPAGAASQGAPARPDPARPARDTPPATNPATSASAAPGLRGRPRAEPPSLPAAGFELGWDHARHGLVPPTDLLAPESPVCQGWMAGRAASGRRTLPASSALRRWLALRVQAWREGGCIDPARLTSQHLARLAVAHCPVLRQPLGGAGTDPLAAEVLRLDAARGWEAGNLVMLSRRAAAALRSSALDAAQRHAVRLTHAAPDACHQGLQAAAWRRVATLHALAASGPALPWHEAAGVALAVLPPPGVVAQHTLLQLQCAVTQWFAQAGWAQRARQLGARLPAGPLRTDWHLFVGALATRWLEAGAPADPLARRQALEDAWQHPRVQRRWQQLALQLDPATCGTLLRGA